MQRGLFDGLKNFRELEARIGALATAQGRGEAFEVFAEAYLAWARETSWPALAHLCVCSDPAGRPSPEPRGKVAYA